MNGVKGISKKRFVSPDLEELWFGNGILLPISYMTVLSCMEL